MISRRLSRGALLLVLLTAACTSDGSTDAWSDQTAEPSAGTPAPEGTGQEEPAPAPNERPRLVLFGLPIGAGVDESFTCATLNWLTEARGGVDIPAGVRVTVRHVDLEGGVTSGSCTERPRCEGYTFTSDTQDSGFCHVPVTLEPGVATLSNRGEVDCGSAPDAECDEFKTEISGNAWKSEFNGPSGSGEQVEPDSSRDQPTQPSAG